MIVLGEVCGLSVTVLGGRQPSIRRRATVGCSELVIWLSALPVAPFSFSEVPS